MTKKKSSWKEIGIFTVDSGLCWIGDPSYILAGGERPEGLGKDWGEFCDNRHAENPPDDQVYWEKDKSRPGLGVCISSGGDGVFVVEIKETEDGRFIEQMRVRFMR